MKASQTIASIIRSYDEIKTETRPDVDAALADHLRSGIIDAQHTAGGYRTNQASETMYRVQTVDGWQGTIVLWGGIDGYGIMEEAC